MYYLYDGSFEGFLSAVTYLMRDRKDLSSFRNRIWGIAVEGFEPALLPGIKTEIVPDILNDFGNYLTKNFGGEILKTIYHAFLSHESGIEDSIVLFILLARKTKQDPSARLYEDCVNKVIRASQKTRRELHRYMGLLRFQKITNPEKLKIENTTGNEICDVLRPDIFVASFEPECDILNLVSEHFANRLSSQFFIIIDRKRDTCSIHIPGEELVLKSMDKSKQSTLAYDSSFENLWCEYFKVISIKERENKTLQRSNLPLKYRKYMTEFND